MIGDSNFGENPRKAHIRLRFISDYESYINAIDMNFQSADPIPSGVIYKLDTLVLVKLIDPNMGKQLI